MKFVLLSLKGKWVDWKCHTSDVEDDEFMFPAIDVLGRGSFCSEEL